MFDLVEGQTPQRKGQLMGIITRNDMLISMIEKAHALIEADREVVKSVVEGDIESLPKLISRFIEAKYQAQTGLAELAVVEGVDDATKKLLDRIQRNFPTDTFVEEMEKNLEEDVPLKWLPDDKVWEIGDKLLYSWISHYEYVENLFKITTLILRAKLPPGLHRYMVVA